MLTLERLKIWTSFIPTIKYLKRKQIQNHISGITKFLFYVYFRNMKVAYFMKGNEMWELDEGFKTDGYIFFNI